MRRRLILMRHGAVDYFAGGRVVHAQGVPLTAEGLRQAEAAGRLLAAQGVRPDLVISSGLPRTEQTATAVLAHCGGPASETWPELQEIEAGRLRSLDAAAVEAAFTRFNRGRLTRASRFLGGERLGDFQDRVLPALDRLRARRDWDCALVVAHGVVNAVWLSHLVSGGGRALLPGWQQNPACLNLIDLGAASGDDLLRAVNLNPMDWLQAGSRESSMELLLRQFRPLLETR